MTILTLDKLHIASLSDLSDALVIKASAFDANVITPSSVRRYSGGVDRVVSTPGRTFSFPITCFHVSRADYDDLLDRAGTTQLLRDTRGRAVAGLISDVSGSEARGFDRMSTVSFTLTSITYSEIV